MSRLFSYNCLVIIQLWILMLLRPNLLIRLLTNWFNFNSFSCLSLTSHISSSLTFYNFQFFYPLFYSTLLSSASSLNIVNFLGIVSGLLRDLLSSWGPCPPCPGMETPVCPRQDDLWGADILQVWVVGDPCVFVCVLMGGFGLFVFFVYVHHMKSVV